MSATALAPNAWFEDLVIEELTGSATAAAADTCYFCYCYAPDDEPTVITASLVAGRA